MNYTKLVFRESPWMEILGKTMTINFDRCKLEIKTFGIVQSCRITPEKCAKLREKLDSCHLEDWAEMYQPPADIAVLDGCNWTLKLFDGRKLVRKSSGYNSYPPSPYWEAFCEAVAFIAPEQ